MPKTPQCKIIMPETLRAACAKQAAKQNITMSQWIRQTLEQSLTKRDQKSIPQVRMVRPCTKNK